MDAEKIKELDRTFRIRSGKYRIIFYSDNTNKTIYVTTVTERKKAYKK